MTALFLSFHGVHISVACDDAFILSELKFDFSAFLRAELETIHCRIQIQTVSPSQIAIPSLVETMRSARFVVYDDKLRRYIDYQGKVLSVHDYSLERTEIYGEDLNALYEVTYLSILSRAGEKLDRRGIHRVHGLGLAFKNQGIIFLAKPGTGKSTLLMGLLSEPDVQLYSEDTPLLDRTGKMLPFPFRLGVAEPNLTMGIPAEWRRTRVNSFGKSKVLINAIFFRDQIAAQGVIPRWLVALSWTTAPSPSITKLSRLRAYRLLIRDCVIGLGVPQLAELFVTFRAKDIAAKSLILTSRLIAITRLVFRVVPSQLNLCRDNIQNVELLRLHLKLESESAISDQRFSTG